MCSIGLLDLVRVVGSAVCCLVCQVGQCFACVELVILSLTVK